MRVAFLRTLEGLAVSPPTARPCSLSQQPRCRRFASTLAAMERRAWKDSYLGGKEAEADLFGLSDAMLTGAISIGANLFRFSITVTGRSQSRCPFG